MVTARLSDVRRRRLLAALLGFVALRWATAVAADTIVPASVAHLPGTVLDLAWALGTAAVVLITIVRRRQDRVLWSVALLALGLLAVRDLLVHPSARDGGLPAVEGIPLPDVLSGVAAAAVTLVAAVFVNRGERGRGIWYTLDGLIVGISLVVATLPLLLAPFWDPIRSSEGLLLAFYLWYTWAAISLLSSGGVAVVSPGPGRPTRLIGIATVLQLAVHQNTAFGTAAPNEAADAGVASLRALQFLLIAVAVRQGWSMPATPADTPMAQRLGVLVLSASLMPTSALIAFHVIPPGPDHMRATALYVHGGLALFAILGGRMAHLVLHYARTLRTLDSTLLEKDRLTSDLRHQSEHDVTTGLPNRYLLTEAAAALRPESGRHTVVFIDLDDFKAVNDRYGHEAGDMVLREIGRRLRRTCRPEDVVARLGGDEFAVLLRRTPPDAAVRTAHRLLELVAEPLLVAGRRVSLGASAGVAELAGDDDDDDRDPLAEADVAMYAAKRAGKNRVLVYAEGMRREVLGDADLAADVLAAIRNGGITAAFQPIVDLTTGRTISLEALARWDHPQRGSVSPAVFLPVAVGRGMADELDLVVIDQALAQMPEWRAITPGLRVAVNASAALLGRQDVVDRLLGLLGRHGLSGDALIVEVTEQSVINDAGQVAAALHELRRHGVLIALDDFGTGYSSLSYLQDLPVDILKLDRSFLVRGVVDGTASPLLRTVARLGRELGMTVLAEGIETEEQYDVLRGIGCHRGQGWLFAKAMPAFEVPHALERPLTAPVR